MHWLNGTVPQTRGRSRESVEKKEKKNPEKRTEIARSLINRRKRKTSAGKNTYQKPSKRWHKPYYN